MPGIWLLARSDEPSPRPSERRLVAPGWTTRGDEGAAGAKGTDPPLLVMRGVSKRYGGVRALHDAELAVEAGRISWPCWERTAPASRP